MAAGTQILVQPALTHLMLIPGTTRLVQLFCVAVISLNVSAMYCPLNLSNIMHKFGNETFCCSHLLLPGTKMAMEKLHVTLNRKLNDTKMFMPYVIKTSYYLHLPDINSAV